MRTSSKTCEELWKHNIWRECIFKAIVQQNSCEKQCDPWIGRDPNLIHPRNSAPILENVAPCQKPNTYLESTQNLNWNRIVRIVLQWRCTAMVKFLTATISGMNMPRVKPHHLYAQLCLELSWKPKEKVDNYQPVAPNGERWQKPHASAKCRRSSASNTSEESESEGEWNSKGMDSRIRMDTKHKNI